MARSGTLMLLEARSLGFESVKSVQHASPCSGHEYGTTG